MSDAASNGRAVRAELRRTPCAWGMLWEGTGEALAAAGVVTGAQLAAVAARGQGRGTVALRLATGYPGRVRRSSARRFAIEEHLAGAALEACRAMNRAGLAARSAQARAAQAHERFASRADVIAALVDEAAPALARVHRLAQGRNPATGEAWPFRLDRESREQIEQLLATVACALGSAEITVLSPRGRGGVDSRRGQS